MNKTGLGLTIALLLTAGAGLVPHAFALPPAAVNLNSAGNYVVLAKSAITNTPTSAITGNLGISPAAASSITGLSMTEDASNQFWTSAQVTGRILAADNAPPTPATMTTAILDMQNAYTDASGRACGVSEGVTDFSGLTFTTNVYCWTANAAASGSFTISGAPTDVFIFIIPGTFTVSNAITVTLAGGAVFSNVFFAVGGATAIGTTANFKGIILDATSITLNTGAVLTGRALAQTAVTLSGNTISAGAVPPVGPIPELPFAYALPIVFAAAIGIYAVVRRRGSLPGLRMP